MTYDIPHRHSQALDPSSLDTIAACLHAIQAAARDCLNAGAPFETDPAVVLLAQHLGAVAVAAYPDVSTLRRLCTDAVADLRAKPVLATLAMRGVASDPDAKRLFHAEARRALKRLADALGLASECYDLRVNAGGPAVSGEVTLHGDRVYVQVSLGGYGPGPILFRSVRGRRDYSGGQNHWARIDELLAPERFANRIAVATGIEIPAKDQLRLVA